MRAVHSSTCPITDTGASNHRTDNPASMVPPAGSTGEEDAALVGALRTRLREMKRDLVAVEAGE